MKKRKPEISLLLLCFFWLPSYGERYITLLPSELIVALIWWYFLNVVCGACYILTGIIILAITAFGIYNIIKKAEKNRILRSAIMLGLTAINMFGVFCAYQLAELWRYM